MTMYETSLRMKHLADDAGSLKEIAERLESEAQMYRDMAAAGVTLEQAEDDYVHLSTEDAKVAERFGIEAVTDDEESGPVFRNIMKEAQTLQAQMAATQEAIAKRTVEATAGGVTVEANGKQELTATRLNPGAGPERMTQPILEDFVLTACNEALRKSRELVQQELGKLTGGRTLA